MAIKFPPKSPKHAVVCVKDKTVIQHGPHNYVFMIGDPIPPHLHPVAMEEGWGAVVPILAPQGETDKSMQQTVDILTKAGADEEAIQKIVDFMNEKVPANSIPPKNHFTAENKFGQEEKWVNVEGMTLTHHPAHMKQWDEVTFNIDPNSGIQPGDILTVNDNCIGPVKVVVKQTAMESHGFAPLTMKVFANKIGIDYSPGPDMISGNMATKPQNGEPMFPQFTHQPTPENGEMLLGWVTSHLPYTDHEFANSLASKAAAGVTFTEKMAKWFDIMFRKAMKNAEKKGLPVQGAATGKVQFKPNLQQIPKFHPKPGENKITILPDTKMMAHAHNYHFGPGTLHSYSMSDALKAKLNEKLKEKANKLMESLGFPDQVAFVDGKKAEVGKTYNVRVGLPMLFRMKKAQVTVGECFIFCGIPVKLMGVPIQPKPTRIITLKAIAYNDLPYGPKSFEYDGGLSKESSHGPNPAWVKVDYPEDAEYQQEHILMPNSKEVSSAKLDEDEFVKPAKKEFTWLVDYEHHGEENPFAMPQKKKLKKVSDAKPPQPIPATVPVIKDEDILF